MDESVQVEVVPTVPIFNDPCYLHLHSKAKATPKAKEFLNINALDLRILNFFDSNSLIYTVSWSILTIYVYGTTLTHIPSDLLFIYIKGRDTYSSTFISVGVGTQRIYLICFVRYSYSVVSMVRKGKCYRGVIGGTF